MTRAKCRRLMPLVGALLLAVLLGAPSLPLGGVVPTAQATGSAGTTNNNPDLLVGNTDSSSTYGNPHAITTACTAAAQNITLTSANTSYNSGATGGANALFVMGIGVNATDVPTHTGPADADWRSAEAPCDHATFSFPGSTWATGAVFVQITCGGSAIGSDSSGNYTGGNIAVDFTSAPQPCEALQPFGFPPYTAYQSGMGWEMELVWVGPNTSVPLSLPSTLHIVWSGNAGDGAPAAAQLIYSTFTAPVSPQGTLNELNVYVRCSGFSLPGSCATGQPMTLVLYDSSHNLIRQCSIGSPGAYDGWTGDDHVTTTQHCYVSPYDLTPSAVYELGVFLSQTGTYGFGDSPFGSKTVCTMAVGTSAPPSTIPSTGCSTGTGGALAIVGIGYVLPAPPPAADTKQPPTMGNVYPGAHQTTVAAGHIVAYRFQPFFGHGVPDVPSGRFAFFVYLDPTTTSKLWNMAVYVGAPGGGPAIRFGGTCTTMHRPTVPSGWDSCIQSTYGGLGMNIPLGFFYWIAILNADNSPGSQLVLDDSTASGSPVQAIDSTGWGVGQPDADPLTSGMPSNWPSNANHTDTNLSVANAAMYIVPWAPAPPPGSETPPGMPIPVFP